MQIEHTMHNLHKYIPFYSEERMFRKMGFYDDQLGIIRRYRREREHWDKHLQHTRQFVLESMQGKNRISAAVLGSGWLLDVPLEEMSRYFERLYLYDIRHPKTVKKQAHKLGNVELRACDISCFARPVYDYVKQQRNNRNRPPISDIQPQKTLDLTEFDFVFSCNILNQLDILLVEYMTQCIDLNQEETLAFRKRVQECHIDLLPANRSCLVADYEEITCSPDDREIARNRSVFLPIVQSACRRWRWNFDTKMTYYSDKKTFFEVLAVEL